MANMVSIRRCLQPLIAPIDAEVKEVAFPSPFSSGVSLREFLFSLVQHLLWSVRSSILVDHPVRISQERLAHFY